jgi:hypothetical protein
MKRSSIFVCSMPSGGRSEYSLEEISGYYGLTRLDGLSPEMEGMLDPDRFNLILQPKSQGQRPRMGAGKFSADWSDCCRGNGIKVFVSGTAAEGQAAGSPACRNILLSPI